MMPIKRQIIPRQHLNRFPRLHIAHDIAAHVDRVDIFDGRVIVAAFAGWAVVGGDADAFEEALVYSVHIYTLGELSQHGSEVGEIGGDDEGGRGEVRVPK